MKSWRMVEEQNVSLIGLFLALALGLSGPSGDWRDGGAAWQYWRRLPRLSAYLSCHPRVCPWPVEEDQDCGWSAACCSPWCRCFVPARVPLANSSRDGFGMRGWVVDPAAPWLSGRSRTQGPVMRDDSERSVKQTLKPKHLQAWHAHSGSVVKCKTQMIIHIECSNSPDDARMSKRLWVHLIRSKGG